MDLGSIILGYLQKIFVKGMILMTAESIVKMREDDIKFYQAPLEFQFFVLSEFLIQFKTKIKRPSLGDLTLFFPFLLYLIIIILCTLFLDKVTPKIYSFIAFIVILGLSVVPFCLNEIVSDIEIPLIVVRLIYGTGFIRCTIIAILHKNHLMISLFTLIQLFLNNIFSLALYNKKDAPLPVVIDFYYVGIVLNVIQLIVYLYLKIPYFKKSNFQQKPNNAEVNISLVCNDTEDQNPSELLQ